MLTRRRLTIRLVLRARREGDRLSEPPTEVGWSFDRRKSQRGVVPCDASAVVPRRALCPQRDLTTPVVGSERESSHLSPRRKSGGLSTGVNRKGVWFHVTRAPSYRVAPYVLSGTSRLPSWARIPDARRALGFGARVRALRASGASFSWCSPGTPCLRPGLVHPVLDTGLIQGAHLFQYRDSYQPTWYMKNAPSVGRCVGRCVIYAVAVRFGAAFNSPRRGGGTSRTRRAFVGSSGACRPVSC